MIKILSLVLKVTNKIFLIFIEFISVNFRHWKQIDYARIQNKKLLVIRHGGIGDLLFITPILRGLKNKYPDIKITLMTRNIYHSLFDKYPYIDKLINHA